MVLFPFFENLFPGGFDFETGGTMLGQVI